ncbi:Retrovirus-related Pol polyprotein from transposon TNT 1-94 [Vitis vinifera]|uniref:Retrovirus-related Pol polyprotein from transposon TNT 1-94 n=1 Tax=Vitis vinifera TaxID=29760 RepID=A0A438FHD5_VITVI|nr:Retrovirus-related Pol polyprotein from transposon TNT 1-94 [Vitis vinifera]
MSTIRLVLGMVAVENLHLEQLDVKTTFLHGDLEENLYMIQPKGFIVQGQENLVCKLRKSLYSLKQAPRQWYKKFDSFMHRIGFKDVKLITVAMLRSGIEKINNLKKQLSKQFAMKYWGVAKQILRMRIIRDKVNGTLKLSQSEYVKKVLSRFNMNEAKLVSTPLGSHFKLSKEQSPKTEEERDHMSKKKRGSTYWSLGREKKEDSRKGDFFWKKTFSTLSVEEEIGKIFGGRLEGSIERGTDSTHPSRLKLSNSPQRLVLPGKKVVKPGSGCDLVGCRSCFNFWGSLFVVFWAAILTGSVQHLSSLLLSLVFQQKCTLKILMKLSLKYLQDHPFVAATRSYYSEPCLLHGAVATLKQRMLFVMKLKPFFFGDLFSEGGRSVRFTDGCVRAPVSVNPTSNYCNMLIQAASEGCYSEDRISDSITSLHEQRKNGFLRNMTCWPYGSEDECLGKPFDIDGLNYDYSTEIEKQEHESDLEINSYEAVSSTETEIKDWLNWVQQASNATGVSKGEESDADKNPELNEELQGASGVLLESQATASRSEQEKELTIVVQ